MKKLLIIGCGGFLGAVLRYVLISLVQNFSKDGLFPHGTLVVNVAGCFLIGILSNLLDTPAALTAELRFFLIIGFLGSFTTYSTFGNETIFLVQNQRYTLALLNVMMHMILGFSAVLAGRAIPV